MQPENTEKTQNLAVEMEHPQDLSNPLENIAFTGLKVNLSVDNPELKLAQEMLLEISTLLQHWAAELVNRVV